MAAPLILAAVTTTIRGGASALGRKAAAELGAQLSALAAEAVKTALEFEQLELRLETVAGSADSASIVFDHMRELARSTPLDVRELTDAFIDLHRGGLAPTDELLQSLGGIATGFGRDISDLSTALVAAVGGQTNALEEFGIRIEAMGDRARVSFGDLAVEVANSAEGIVDAVQRIAEANFADSMKREADTVIGAWGDMTAAAADLASSLLEFSNLDDGMARTLQIATALMDGLRRIIDPTTEEELGGLNTQIGALNESIARSNSELERIPEISEGDISSRNEEEEGGLTPQQTYDQDRRAFLQSVIEMDEQYRNLLIERRNALVSEREREDEILDEIINTPSSGRPSSPAGQPSGGSAGLRVVPHSETDAETICDCLNALVATSPIPEGGVALDPPLIDLPAGEGSGSFVPVSSETVDKLKSAKVAAAEYADSVGDIAEQSQTAQEVSQLFGNAAGNAMRQLIDGSFSAADAVQALIDQLIQLLIIDPFVEAITGFVEGVLSPSANKPSGKKMHSGGIVGTALASSGLAADEVPAILQRGEGVFTPEQMAALGPGGGGGDVTVNVIDQRGGDKAPVEVTERQSNGRREIEVLIVDTVTRNIGRRGSVGQAIETTFGARRQGVR